MHVHCIVCFATTLLTLHSTAQSSQPKSGFVCCEMRVQLAVFNVDFPAVNHWFAMTLRNWLQKRISWAFIPTYSLQALALLPSEPRP